MRNEPRQMRGEWFAPPPRIMWLPPPTPRWPAPRRECDHCGLAAETTSPRCPVCDAPYPKTGVRGAVSRLLHRQ